MKIAITSQGEELTSAVDPRFGRARWFRIFDLESGESELLDNQDLSDVSQGVGPLAVQKMASKGINVVITGHCGPNAFRALKAAGIEVALGAKGNVQDVLEKYKKGEFNTSQNPDIQGHWQGMK